MSEAEKLAKIALIEADLDAEDDLFSSGANDGEFEFDLDLIDATVVPEVEEVVVEEPTLDTTKFGFEVYESGSGDQIKRGQTVKVDYVGTFLDGTEFDSSRSRGPFEFVAGKGNVIKCWDFAIVNLNVGDKAKLNCPSFTAYGDRGNSAIPGGATLQFDIHVVSGEAVEEEEEGFGSYGGRASAIREALKSDKSRERAAEIERLRARTKSFALTSIEEELTEKPAEKPQRDAIAELDVDKIEIPDLFSLASRMRAQPEPVVEEEDEVDIYDEDDMPAEQLSEDQIAAKRRIQALIERQKSFKLESIEDSMYAVGRNTRPVRANTQEPEKATEDKSQFGDENNSEDELMARLRRIEAEASSE